MGTDGERQIWLPGVGERSLSEVTVELLEQSARLLERSPRSAVLAQLRAAILRLDEINEHAADETQRAEAERLRHRIEEYNAWLTGEL